MTTKSLTYKIASEPSEFEQIYRLNYKTFVGEIPQHEENEENRLVDRFDKENTYIICLDEERIVGMICARGKRPFSLDQKLDDLDSFFPEDRKMCEIRLLAVEKEYRNGRVFLGLARELIDYCVKSGYDMAVISGTLRQLKLYKHLGFVPFGPIVGTEEAPFQPMYLTKEAFDKKEAMFRRLNALPKEEKSEENERKTVSFLPGPVRIAEEVRKTLGERAISHRSKRFVDDFQQVKQQLRELVNARHVEILLGSGTLGNDAVGAQISLLDGPGLIVTNGEFGERLLDHAERLGLSYKTLQYEWGETIDYQAVRDFLKQNPKVKWLWTVHCETSTGLLNRIEVLKEICREEEVKLCLDCCSSIGVVPVDLEGVYLASSSSGKGLSSFAGLAMVFYHHDIKPNQSLPRYLDLGMYASKQGVPFTHSSNLVYALNTALKRFEEGESFKDIANLAQWLREALRAHGYDIFGSDEDMTPGIVTIALPSTLNSEKVGDELERAGYWLSYRSDYLLKRNWIQISLMGEHTKTELEALLTEIKKATNK
ncbi:MAG TPA: aminotransferase class V-fold PLP-dependent enzyme [Bacillales bacterium]|nr:aminotransferase class V-fold PLP-dependent enzyme [Bacillales bacterium]